MEAGAHADIPPVQPILPVLPVLARLFLHWRRGPTTCTPTRLLGTPPGAN